jgi:hypothetical protein
VSLHPEAHVILRLRSLGTSVFVALLLVAVFRSLAGAQTLPTPPQVTVDTTYVAPTGRTIAVAAGGDLQAALNAAVPGDVITLAASATYTGTFTLPLKSGTGWITVRTAAPDSALPAPGTRVTPAYAAQMPKLVGPGGAPAVNTAPGAHHYRFIGVQFAPAAGTYNWSLVNLGESDEPVLANTPHHIILDRCLVRGDAATGGKRGITLNGRHLAVIDSYVWDWKGVGQETQAIAGWNGAGPFKIVNNYLEAAGINVLLGGADPAVTNLVPSDIELRRNLVTKPLKWRVGDPSYAGTHWTVKNALELKNAQRIVIDGNVFENVWGDAQTGFAIVFTGRNSDGTAPWSVVRDVAFTNNVVRHAASGVVVTGYDDVNPSQQTERVLIRNNVFEDIDERWGGDGRLFQPLGNIRDLTIEHTTGFAMTVLIMAAGPGPNPGFVFRNNLVTNGQYGIVGDGVGTGLAALNAYFPAAVFTRNAIIGGSSGSYPPGNYFPASTSAVGFTDYAKGDYRLTAASAYHDAATDGTDIGVDFDAMAAAMAGAPTVPPPPPPPSGDTTAPTVSITSPASGAAVAGSVRVTVAMSDAVGVTSSEVRIDGALVGTFSGPITGYTWDTVTSPDGAHVVTVNASDAAGNRGSTSATYVVNNAAPAVKITRPAEGASVRKRFKIAVSATDTVRVISVKIYGDGALVGTVPCSAATCTGSVYWTVTRGAHTITAIATNSAGKTATAPPVHVVR